MSDRFGEEYWEERYRGHGADRHAPVGGAVVDDEQRAARRDRRRQPGSVSR